MNIYLHELKSNLRSVLIWSASITGLLFVFLSIFPAFSADVEVLNELIANYPPEFLAAFGMSTELNMAELLGFLSFTFLFVQICVSIQAANYGISLVSVEERELTADFLLAKPVSRIKILTSKFLATLTSLLITNIIIWVAIFAFIALLVSDSDYDQNTLVLLLLTVVFLQMFFLTVGLALSLTMKKVKSVTPVSMGLVFGMYILSTLGSTLKEDKFAYVTPFKHFEASYIVANGEYNWPLVSISVAVILVAVVVSYFLYQKRDVHSI